MIEALPPYFGGFVWFGLVLLVLWGRKKDRKCSCNRWKCGKCGGDVYR